MIARAACAIALLASVGCTLPSDDGFPPAKLELVSKATNASAEGGLHFRFARSRSGSVIDYGHDVTFAFDGPVHRIAFNQRRKVPEAWALRWQNAETKAIHEVVVLVLERGDDPTVELIRPYGREGPPFEWVPDTNYPELGRQIGVYAGAKVKFRLDADGTVTALNAARGARPRSLVPRPTKH